MYNILEALHERSLVALADKLPWRLPVGDGIVMTNQGGFLASYEYSGPDPQSVAEDDIEHLSESVNDALMRLDNGWSVFVNLYRVPASPYPTGGAFPARVARLLDEERRAYHDREGGHFESRSVLSLCYHPAKAAKAAMERWFFAGSGIDEASAGAEQAIRTFEAGIADFERTFGRSLRLRRLGLRTALDELGRPLVYDDHLSFLYYCMRGIRQPMLAPPTGMSVANLFSAHEMVADWKPTIDQDAIVVLGVTAPPRETYLRILHDLHSLPMEFRASLRVIMMGKGPAEKEIERKRAEWGHSVFGFFESFSRQAGNTARPNRFAIDMEVDADNALKRSVGGELRFGQATFNVVIFGKDRARAVAHAEQAVVLLRDLGFVANVERVLASRAYFGSLPGEVYANVNRLCLSTQNVAHTMPLTSVWPGVDTHPSPYYPPGSPALILATTTGASPIRLPLHWNTPGNTLIVGSQGGGKTTLLKRILWSHLRYPGAQAFVLDRDRGMFALANALALDGVASYYDLGNPESIGLCPFAHIDESPAERAYALSFVEQLMHHQGYEPNVEARRLIQHGIDQLARQEHRNLDALAALVPLKELWSVVAFYTASELGRMLNARNESLDDRAVQIFETEALANLDDTIRLPILRQIVHIADRRARMRRPGLFLFDEASVYLRDGFMATAILEVLRRWRKMNVAGVLATQGPNDILNAGDLGMALIQECKTKIFTGDTSATNDDIAPLLHRLGLLPGEERMLAGLEEERGYYYTSPLGRAPFTLGLGPVELAVIACDEGERRQRVEELIAEHPVDWLEIHLREQGVPEWADYFTSLTLRSGAA